jgi:uncharacterized protein
MNSEDVANYLRAHPEFFEQHTELLSQVMLPHPYGGRAIPLSERQLLALRERNRALQGKLTELIQFGEENDTIGERIHRLSLALVGAVDLDSVIGVIHDSLREDFGVPHVAMRFWRGAGQRAEFAPVTDQLREYATSLEQPFCGPNEKLEPADWFSVGSEHVRSIALCVLNDAETPFGMLALASEDPERFYPEMGRLYLARIGELIGAALVRHL